ncbi:hypothetical protein KO494_00280 [Lacinutrix sp. C3R15]|uniref:hypothetical protein n=1 Tax=Flavobacteriaceae TaxID=49546 RepID=UPI001C08D0BA|nr:MULTISPECIES: hypothetical protein [Flavobacteriaceae]MBU2937963.1 hypothetical protein [Lacinutrix sp. C3R15]MDO6621277.1 hypothetical protein [Oceanihabitans sp. 1_MG-2023]
MKRKLESELMSIAHKILKLKGKEDVNKMHAEVAALYEKLTVLKFAQENFEESFPTIGNDSSFFGMLDTAFNNKVSDNIEIEDKIYVDMDENENEAIMEHATEKIKDIVAQMPEETQHVDDFLETIIPKTQYHKNDLEEITADFTEMPVFEKVTNTNEKKSLNEKLKNGALNIGLNDKIAFIKKLFDGKNEDYERVISQINTLESFTEAQNFIQNIVKPDYNNWADNEEIEVRFMEIIESKYQ